MLILQTEDRQLFTFTSGERIRKELLNRNDKSICLMTIPLTFFENRVIIPLTFFRNGGIIPLSFFEDVGKSFDI